jgi:hypothetical protein
LNQVSPAEIGDGHPLEVVRGYPQRDFDERFQLDGSNLALGNRLAAEVIADFRAPVAEIPESYGRNHDYQYAIALAIAAGDMRDSRQQDTADRANACRR